MIYIKSNFACCVAYKTKLTTKLLYIAWWKNCVCINNLINKLIDEII